MPYNATAPTNDVAALADLVNTSIAAGYTPDPGLDGFGIVSSILRQVLTGVPSQFSINAAAGAAGAFTSIVKTVTGIVDNVATDTFTVTVPNAQHRAAFRFTVISGLGAGGAVGAGEAAGATMGVCAIVRTAGVNAVAGYTVLTGAANNVAVAGAATQTCVITISAVAGAVGAVNTFTVKVTVVKSAGSSAAHTATLICECLNSQASGITVA
jgi:hypothetical protein